MDTHSSQQQPRCSERCSSTQEHRILEGDTERERERERERRKGYLVNSDSILSAHIYIGLRR
jgi:hypothetical protein